MQNKLTARDVRIVTRMTLKCIFFNHFPVGISQLFNGFLLSNALKIKKYAAPFH